MTPLVKKAHRGNRDAMTELYQSNKNYVFYLCNLLLCDPKAADNACAYVFKNAWDYILDGKIETEKDFTDYVVKKAVSHCKNKFAKSNNKAFKIPMNKNFGATQYASESVVTEGELHEQLLASLPPLHRFIYVLHSIGEWSEEEIAELIHTKPDVIKAALDAEQMNLDRIAQVIKQKTGKESSISKEEFHSLLVEGMMTSVVPNAINTVAILAIDAIADPIAEKAKKKMMKIGLTSIVSIILVIAMIFGIVAIVKNAGTEDPNTDDSGGGTSDDTGDDITWLTEVEDPTHYAIIDIADYGKITVALDGNTAPETVENFVSLAEEGFYDGLTFHRIIEGFMMQGGDPKADGTGGHYDEDGNEVNITGEFYYNGCDNYLSHVRGAISMARGDDYDSASSQFFIVHKDYPSLDTLYAVFGYVIDGIEVVDAVCEAAVPTDDNGTIEFEDQPVITTITIYTPDEYEQLLADSIVDVTPTAIDAKIAEVTAINEGVLSLTYYGLTGSGADYEITDLKDVDLTNYEATEETAEYTISADTVIYTVVDGALTEIESSEIVVGDMLVMDDGADEGITIVVYHLN